MSLAPDQRLRPLNDRPLRPSGDYVLYWMTMARRRGWSWALEHAVERAFRLRRPLVILEALRVAYPWASPRLHAFVVQGMAANLKAFRGAPVLYHPYLEPTPGAGAGLLAALAAGACLVVADDYPAFFLPRMLAAAAEKVDVLMEAVDGCGLLPLAAGEKAHASAYALRRHLHKVLPGHLADLPAADPLAGVALKRLKALPRAITERWPAAGADLLEGSPSALAELGLSGPAPVDARGGEDAAEAHLADFIADGLSRYDQDQRQPSAGAVSRLSPWLHFGHIAPQRIFQAVASAESWAPHRLNPGAKGKKAGFWGMSPAAEAFLDQLITWRELGFNTCRYLPGYDRYQSLPDWARATLADHAGDQRAYRYSLDELAAASTHDPIWNAAQTQLNREGVIHNYLRMLWGKKILEWSGSPEEAWEVMVELNNRLAIDGRDPNSWSGIAWCLGRYDRPFAERAIFGKVRYMSSDSTRRKLDLKDYLGQYGRD